MFLQQPHLASGYFSKVYTTNKEKMFIEGDKYNSYYISSFSMYRLNSLLNAKVLAKKYRVAKYHLIMIFLMLIDKDIPRMNSRGMETYCNKVKKVLLDDKETIRYFKNSINILNSVNTINLEEQETLYLAENTQLIIEKLGDQSKN